LRYAFEEGFNSNTSDVDLSATSDNKLGDAIESDLRLATPSLIGRNPYTTRDGHFGVVPKAGQEDDLIVVLDCPFPVVLRPSGDEYEYIGECYLRGFMDSEATKFAKQSA